MHRHTFEQNCFLEWNEMKQIWNKENILVISQLNDFDIYSHENVLYFETLFFIAQMVNGKNFITQMMKEMLRMINSQTLFLKSI